MPRLERDKTTGAIFFRRTKQEREEGRARRLLLRYHHIVEALLAVLPEAQQTQLLQKLEGRKDLQRLALRAMGRGSGAS